MTGPDFTPCPACHGKGHRPRMFKVRTGAVGRPASVERQVPCWTCKGAGISPYVRGMA